MEVIYTFLVWSSKSAHGFSFQSVYDHGFFSKWADEVFFPTIDESRERIGSQGLALLIRDSCSSHYSAQFLTECEARNIYVLFLVAYSSDQGQPLDLLTFGLLKRHFAGITFHALKSDQSKKVMKMIGA
jgi:hypothetical protein